MLGAADWSSTPGPNAENSWPQPRLMYLLHSHFTCIFVNIIEGGVERLLEPEDQSACCEIMKIRTQISNIHMTKQSTAVCHNLSSGLGKIGGSLGLAGHLA